MYLNWPVWNQETYTHQLRSLLLTDEDGQEIIQVSFKKEVGARVNDLVCWLTLWLNFENLWLTFKWHMIMWQ